jgi:hypothetical protein
MNIPKLGMLTTTLIYVPKESSILMSTLVYIPKSSILMRMLRGTLLHFGIYIIVLMRYQNKDEEEGAKKI